MLNLQECSCARSVSCLWLSVKLLVTLLVCSPLTVHAHQSLRQPPPAAELAKIQPPMLGSEEFASQVVDHLKNRLTANHLELLDSIESHLAQAKQIRMGRVEGAKPIEADYHRWLAEQDLVKMMASLPDVIELDNRQGPPKRDPDEQILLDPQYNLLLLKVVTGDGPVSFRVQTWDMVAEYYTPAYTAEIGNGGTTYLMLKLKQFPEKGAFSRLALQERGKDAPSFWHGFNIRSKPWGHLALDARDENGEVTPVLLQIASHDGRRLWEPPGAVDLCGQLNDIVPHLSSLGRGYVFFLPGKNRGRYWIVPEPIEMILPEGKWDLTILHGPEYLPVRETVTIRKDQWTRKSYRLQRWINMPEKGWYSGDDHVHARWISSEDSKNLMDYTRAVNIHVSNILEMGDPLRTYYAQRGYGPEFRVQHENHWLVPGQEDPRSELGHAIGLNLTSMARDLDRYLMNDWVAAEIHRQGGLYGHTHMGADACFVHREMAIFTPMEIVDFNSIMQADLGTKLYYQMLNLGFKMTASAGADTPYGGTIGAVRVYACTGTDGEFTPDQWFAAMKAGNTFVTNGPMIEFTVDDALPGEEIAVTENRQLKVRAKVSGIPGSSAPKIVKLVRLGETILEKRTESSAEGTVEFEIDVPAEFGAWLAIHAVGHDGSEAHTTPVYVKREGFRHWNVDLAGQLIQRQFDVLEETDAALKKSEEMVASGADPLDYWNRCNARQAEQVRERLSKARRFYEKLKKQLEDERISRAANQPTKKLSVLSERLD